MSVAIVDVSDYIQSFYNPMKSSRVWYIDQGTPFGILRFRTSMKRINS